MHATGAEPREDLAMTVLHIRRKIDSETLHLPELRPLIGKTVEITVAEPMAALPGTGDWDAASAVRTLAGYDFDAWREQRDHDRRNGPDHVL
jgi:hypothetical protein